MSDYYSNKQNKSLPAMLKCAADGKLEKNSMFSNNMLKKRSFNPNAQITCRKHTASAATELLCSSCRKHKPIEFFSKNERKSSGAQRCRACVEWTECDEPDRIPLPAPNSVRDHEEKDVYKGNPKNHVPLHVDEYGDYVTQGYAHAVDDSWVGRSRETTGAETGEGLTLENLKIINDAGNSRSTSSHGRGSYHPSSAPTDTASTAGTEDTARPRDAHQFNAYGPNGQLQKRQTSSASSVTSGTSRSTTAGKDWAKGSTRKYAPALPRHMEYENPDTVGYDAYDDDDSSDGC